MLKIILGFLTGGISGYAVAKRAPSKEDIDEAMQMYRETVRRNDDDNLLLRQGNSILLRENAELRERIFDLEKKLIQL